MTADDELKADLRRAKRATSRIDLFHAIAIVKIVEGGEGRRRAASPYRAARGRSRAREVA